MGWDGHGLIERLRKMSRKPRKKFMKPKITTPHPAKRRTKARAVVIVNDYRILVRGEARLKKRKRYDTIPDYAPALLSYCPTLRQARAKARWENLGEAQQVEAAAKAIFEFSYHNESDPFIRRLKTPLPTWEQLTTEAPVNGIVCNCRGKARAVLQLLAGNGTGGGR